MRRRIRILPAAGRGCRLAQCLALALTALAALFWAGSAQAGQGGMLVPGAAPLPEFRINFPDLLLAQMGPPAGDLSISVTDRDHSVINFLFSPRSAFAFDTDPQTGLRRSYAGLSWNVFESGKFYGALGLGGALTQPSATDPVHSWRFLGPALALHSTFEIGYQLSDGHDLTLSLDRASEPSILTNHNELDDFRLRYGLKF